MTPGSIRTHFRGTATGDPRNDSADGIAKMEDNPKEGREDNLPQKHPGTWIDIHHEKLQCRTDRLFRPVAGPFGLIGLLNVVNSAVIVLGIFSDCSLLRFFIVWINPNEEAVMSIKEEVRRSGPGRTVSAKNVDLKFEVVVIPVSDVDRSKK